MTAAFQTGKTYEGTYINGSGTLRVKAYWVHSSGEKMLVEYTSSRNKLDHSEMASAKIVCAGDTAYFKTKGGADVRVSASKEVGLQ